MIKIRSMHNFVSKGTQIVYLNLILEYNKVSNQFERLGICGVYVNSSIIKVKTQWIKFYYVNTYLYMIWLRK